MWHAKWISDVDVESQKDIIDGYSCLRWRLHDKTRTCKSLNHVHIVIIQVKTRFGDHPQREEG